MAYLRHAICPLLGSMEDPMPTTTRELGASAMFGSKTPLTETRKPLCPHCSSGAIVMAPGHILAGGTGMIRIEYRCHDCGVLFWLLQYLTLGLGVGVRAEGRASVSGEQASRRGSRNATTRPRSSSAELPHTERRGNGQAW
jgi:hypothetical protein